MAENKFLKEYKKTKDDYLKLVESLVPLLKEILAIYDIHYQAIQARVKKEASFKKNLFGDKYKKKKISSLNEIPDLAACRVIFYSRKDLDRFKKILEREFDIVDVDNKMHNDGYKGFHFVASLGKTRGSLTEYKGLSNLNFEIQLTLIFAHGWNEWEHDIFYKDKKGVKDDFPDQFNELSKIAAKISEQIRDAQEAWEYVGMQYEQAAQGKSIFSLKTFKDLTRNNDNNKIFNGLNSVKGLIEEIGELPITLEVDKLAKYLETIIKKSQTNELVDEKTLFGMWPAKTTDDIVKVVLDISDSLVYLDMESIVNLLLNIYPNQSREIRSEIQEWFKKFTKYKYHILKKQGYIVQAFFMDVISKWDSKSRKRYFNVICSIAESIFGPDFETSSKTDYKTISFQRGGLCSDKYIKKIRNKLIDFLKVIYVENNSVENRVKIIKVLDKAMQVSAYGGEIRAVAKRDTKKIISFYNSILSTASSREISVMETSVIWAEKRFGPDDIGEVKIFWSKIRNIDEYILYVALVGYDRSSGLREDVGYEKNKIRREKEVEELVEGMNEDNFSIWEERIVNISIEVDESDDIGKYFHFGKLLQGIGEKREMLAFKLLLDNKIKTFQEYLIAGLLRNKRSVVISRIKKIISAKISKGQFLYEIARAYWFIGEEGSIILGRVFSRVTRRRDKSEMIKVSWQLLQCLKFKKKNQNLILKIIDHLNKIAYYQWTSLYFSNRKDLKDDIFANLKEEGWDIVIKTLVGTKRIDYHEENILSLLIRSNPKRFVEVFRTRVIKKNNRKVSLRDYDAIPYRMYYLTEEGRKILKDKNKLIIDEVLDWLNYDYGWQVGIFLKTIYPEPDNYLEESIFEIIDRKNKKEWRKKVLPFMRWYRSSNIEKYVLRTIEKLDKDDAIWGLCMGNLLNPGASTGNIDDPIIADAYRKKLEMVSAWDCKENDKVNEFKGKCIEYLERQIKIEDDQHRERLASMKRKYPVKEGDKV